MNNKEAEKQKTLTAERQVSFVRMLIIIFGTATFFTMPDDHLNKPLAYVLTGINWTYSLYVVIARPYERHSIFTTSWLTSITDCLLIILWLYATGGYYSPYHVIFYTSIIAVSFRFNLKQTMIIATIYSVCYAGLLISMEHLTANGPSIAVRVGFIYIIGFMTNLITSETLYQTQQKLAMQKLVDEARINHEKLQQNQKELQQLNHRLQLRNSIFNHAEENALIGSFAWNIKTNELEYSDNLYRLLGYDPRGFTPSLEKYLTFIHPEDKNTVLRAWEQAVKTKKIESGVHRILTKNNKLRYIRAAGRVIGDENYDMIIGTFQDITEDVELNAVLKQKNLDLERTNNELASFNYIASHDLQEPLRKIQTFTRLITEKEETSFSDTAKGYLGRIASAAKRMQHLIDAFLNYSRMNNAKLVLEKTDLNVIIDEVINSLADSIQEKKVVVEKTVLPVLPAVPFQMQQLFINLLNNAIKYSKAGVPPVIKINAQKITSKNMEFPDANPAIHYWKISVEDNGIGFDQKYADKIFEVFQRLHNKEEYEGTGIGLAICKKIVLLHKGFISVSSEPGKGTCFNIFLPA